MGAWVHGRKDRHSGNHAMRDYPESITKLCKSLLYILTHKIPQNNNAILTSASFALARPKPWRRLVLCV